MNKLTGALLLAAMTVPTLAGAQDWRGGDHRGDHGQAPRPPRPPAPAQPPLRAPATTGQQRLGGGQPFAGQRPQGFGTPPPAFNGAPRFDGRPFAGQPRPVPQGYQPRFNGGQPRPAPQVGQRFEGRRGQPGAFAPVPGSRGDEEARGRYRPEGEFHGAGRAYDGVARGNGAGYRVEGDRGPGQWNRGWRGDPRFDWNGYRRYNGEAFRLPRYSAPYGWPYGYQRFGVGVVIDEGLFAQDYWIDDPYDYRLPPAYGPYRWVRYYDDALLVDIYTGEVVDTVYGIFD